MQREPAGLLAHGLGGVGKTTLARGFVQWLLETEGIAPDRVFWFPFDADIRTAEYVINRLGEPLFGPQFITAPLEQRIERVLDLWWQVALVLKQRAGCRQRNPPALWRRCQGNSASQPVVRHAASQHFIANHHYRKLVTAKSR